MSTADKKAEQANKKALGKPGVTSSQHDLPADKNSYKQVQQADQPQNVSTPTSPDDEMNSKRSQTDNMNAHIKQNVPPDF